MNDILAGILTDKPIDGRPLHAYRASETEFNDLRQRLRSLLASKQNKSAAALFVLWASEKYRRDFDGGAFSWSFLTDALSLNLDQSDLRDMTGIGLRALKRPPPNETQAGNTQYLRTIAAEGGIPVRFLSSQGGYRAALVGLIADLGRFGLGCPQEQAMSFVARRTARLPLGYRTLEFRELFLRFAREVLELKALAPHALAPDQVEGWLDREKPGWREELSLRLDEDSARSLLSEAVAVSNRTGLHSEPLKRVLIRSDEDAWQGDIERLTLFLADLPFDWDIPLWPGTKALTVARNSGAKVSLAMRWTDMKALDMSQKLDLFRLVARTEASLHALDEIPSQNGLFHLAEIQIKGRDFAVVSGSGEATHIDAMWGSVAKGPLLLGPKPQTKLSASLSPEKLTAFGEGNSAQRGIKTELDGSVSQFGTDFWKIVSALRPQAFAAGRQLASVTYSDRYLRSPLTARLLFEAIRKVPLLSETTSLKIISETTGQIGRPGYQLHHNWETDALRKGALMALLPKAEVRLVPKADCAHARYFRLNFDDGSFITVFLDQGLGAWRTASSRPIRFDHSASAQSQAKELRGLSFDIAIQEGGAISSPIWVSW